MLSTKNLITPFTISSMYSIVDFLKFSYFPFLSGRFKIISIFYVSLFSLVTLGHDAFMLFSILPPFDFCNLICFTQIHVVTVILGDLMMVILMFIVLFAKIDYSEYEVSWKLIGLSLANELIANEIKSTKKDTKLFIAIYSFFWLLTSPFCLYMNLSSHHPFGLLQMTIEMSHIIAYGIIAILVFIKMHTIFTSSSLIKVTFRAIGHCIETHPEVTWNLESLQYYRRMYTQTIELTNTANRIWSFYLSFMYPSFNIMGLLLLYTMVSSGYDPWRYFILGSTSIALFWTLSFLNKYIIGINTEAAALHDIVYRKSLLDLDERYMLEALLFLERIAREDVGYKLHGKFVFSPTLMASMVTLGVTIVIAFPSFITIKL
ncbi:uncharacterized protein LOC128391200 [Panonychus citri]|uniref:uncharacterized protein LOC128391200 n=1 Tax=Panonychus citri TaxID=50023 RepID=UPI002307092B|nr:uncharacterized protein LOC128391200 [Panonychus citri]